MTQEKLRFSDDVQKQLKAYVYRLIDPRNGETFYVGRGQGNRVFDHVTGVLNSIKKNEGEDNESLKLQQIQAITNTGMSVLHVVHRHGMDVDTAKEVEAALIDAYPGLTNIQNGQGSNEYGSMHALEVIEKYEAPEADFDGIKGLLISVNRSSEDLSLYEAVRFSWKTDLKRAKSADYVFAVIRGVIRGVYIADEWLSATSENFPGRPNEPERNAFNGKEAPADIWKQFCGCRLPVDVRFGSGNPIRYINL